jgi:hypothetical protein
MKYRFVLVSCLIIFSFLCCHKEASIDYRSTGKIIGPDYRMCACCGGWYIQIDSLTYEFDLLPGNSNIDLEKDTFPILVKLDWELSSKAACSDKRITIQRISRTN